MFGIERLIQFCIIKMRIFSRRGSYGGWTADFFFSFAGMGCVLRIRAAVRSAELNLYEIILRWIRELESVIENLNFLKNISEVNIHTDLL